MENKNIDSKVIYLDKISDEIIEVLAKNEVSISSLEKVLDFIVEKIKSNTIVQKKI